MIKLQVALDFRTKEEAIKIADAVRDHVDFIEAGTPLIKAVGASVITALKERYPDKTIVADMKTMDTGFFEAEIAFDAGADVACVLGAADIGTVKGMADSAQKRGKMSMVDSIGVDDIEGLVAKIKGSGVDYFVIHSGIDQQEGGRSPFTDLEKTKGLGIDAKIALVGGLNAESLKNLSRYPEVELVMVGGAITKAEDPGKAAEEIRGVLDAIRKEDGP